MLRCLLHSKLHRAVVTDANVDYEGSISIDHDLLDAAGIAPFEKVLIGNQANGNRFETYAIPAPRGSRAITLNGATALLGKKGDVLTIMTFAMIEEADIKAHDPRVVLLHPDNSIKERKAGI